MGQPGVVHSFDDDNHFSQSKEVTDFMDRFYGIAFPNMIRNEFNTDPDGQRAGIDRIIYVAGGQVIYIDEKIRRERWPDFALEYLSNDATGALGWMNKDLDIDYVAYVWLAERAGYLLPWQELTRAWALCGDGWKKRYGSIQAQNARYKTLSVPVPRRNLLDVVPGGIRIQVPNGLGLTSAQIQTAHNNS